VKTKMLLVAFILFSALSALAQHDRFDRNDGRRDQWDNQQNSRLSWEIKNKVDQIRFLAQGRAIENLSDRELIILNEGLARSLELLQDAERRGYGYPQPGPGPGPNPYPQPQYPYPHPVPGPGPRPY